MNNIKQQLFDQCVQYAETRMRTAEEAIRSARESAENDTKSSAGDKYETSREMLQQEISRNQSQLEEAKRLLTTLRTIDPQKRCTIALPGALVRTSNGNFFLAISAGQLNLTNEAFFALSPSSPIGQRLKGLKAGDHFVFNRKEYEVLDIM